MLKKLYIVVLILFNLELYAQVELKISPTLKFNQVDSVFHIDTISSLRFYISNIKLTSAKGILSYESPQAYLLDIENSESFNIRLNTKNKSFSKITFDVGIDSLTNVSGALDGDLDPTNGMYWAWQSGYINLKLEGKSNLCKNATHEFSFHIGGYLPPFYALRKIEIPLQIQENNSIEIEMNLTKLLTKIDLAKINRVMIPSHEAMQIADYFQEIFSLK